MKYDHTDAAEGARVMLKPQPRRELRSFGESAHEIWAAYPQPVAHNPHEYYCEEN